MSQKSHVFKKATLSLQYVCHSKEKEEYKMNQLLIHGLPHGVEKEVYELRIADCLEMDEEEDFNLVINDDLSAVITFTNSYSAKGKASKQISFHYSLLACFRATADDGQNNQHRHRWHRCDGRNGQRCQTQPSRE